MIMDQDFSLTPSLVIYLTVKWNWKNTQRHHHQWIWYKMEWTLESSKICRKNKKRKKHNVMKVEWVLVIHCYCFFHEACFSGDQEYICEWIYFDIYSFTSLSMNLTGRKYPSLLFLYFHSIDCCVSFRKLKTYIQRGKHRQKILS